MERSEINDVIDNSDNELLNMIENKLEEFSKNQEQNIEKQTSCI